VSLTFNILRQTGGITRDVLTLGLCGWLQGKICATMRVHTYPTLMWGTAEHFIAAFEDSEEIKKLHLAEGENAKKVDDIIRDMEQFFGVSAAEKLSSSITGVPLHHFHEMSFLLALGQTLTCSSWNSSS
jgi:hypothetical protein